MRFKSFEDEDEHEHEYEYETSDALMSYFADLAQFLYSIWPADCLAGGSPGPWTSEPWTSEPL